MTDVMIWGFQALAGGALVLAAYRGRVRREGAACAAAAADAEKEAGRGALRDVLGAAWKKAKGRGALHRGGFAPSMGIVALSECIRRLDRGEDVDADVIADALELLGLHLERDEDGDVTVCEN